MLWFEYTVIGTLQVLLDSPGDIWSRNASLGEANCKTNESCQTDLAAAIFCVLKPMYEYSGIIETFVRTEGEAEVPSVSFSKFSLRIVNRLNWNFGRILKIKKNIIYQFFHLKYIDFRVSLSLLVEWRSRDSPTSCMAWIFYSFFLAFKCSGWAETAIFHRVLWVRYYRHPPIFLGKTRPYLKLKWFT